MTEKKVVRDARIGEFVRTQEATRCPATTVTETETVKVPSKRR